MNRLKFSDFIMFEKAPYEQPDFRNLTELIINGVRGEEKVYGPVFISKMVKYALQFVAQKSGEVPPENIENLDQLTEYLLSRSDKCPPYCAAMYAQLKTENDFHDQTGIGTRVEMITMVRKVIEKPKEETVKNIDIDFVLSAVRQGGIEMKTVPHEMGYKKNEDGSIDVIYPICYFSEVCQLALSQVLLDRPDGRMRCGALGEFGCQVLKIATGHEWDYDVLEFNKPHCIVRFYMF